MYISSIRLEFVLMNKVYDFAFCFSSTWLCFLKVTVLIVFKQQRKRRLEFLGTTRKKHRTLELKLSHITHLPFRFPKGLSVLDNCCITVFKYLISYKTKQPQQMKICTVVTLVNKCQSIKRLSLLVYYSKSAKNVCK